MNKKYLKEILLLTRKSKEVNYLVVELGNSYSLIYSKSSDNFIIDKNDSNVISSFINSALSKAEFKRIIKFISLKNMSFKIKVLNDAFTTGLTYLENLYIFSYNKNTDVLNIKKEKNIIGDNLCKDKTESLEDIIDTKLLEADDVFAIHNSFMNTNYCKELLKEFKFLTFLEEKLESNIFINTNPEFIKLNINVLNNLMKVRYLETSYNTMKKYPSLFKDVLEYKLIYNVEHITRGVNNFNSKSPSELKKYSGSFFEGLLTTFYNRVPSDLKEYIEPFISGLSNIPGFTILEVNKELSDSQLIKNYEKCNEKEKDFFIFFLELDKKYFSQIVSFYTELVNYKKDNDLKTFKQIVYMFDDVDYSKRLITKFVKNNFNNIKRKPNGYSPLKDILEYLELVKANPSLEKIPFKDIVDKINNNNEYLSKKGADLQLFKYNYLISNFNADLNIFSKIDNININE